MDSFALQGIGSDDSSHLIWLGMSYLELVQLCQVLSKDGSQGGHEV